MKTIHFLFSSITFFQLYIPILLEARKRNIQSIFYIRKNKKDYANVFSKENKEIFDNFVEQYNIQVESIDNLNSIKGLLFVVDGDIYGPPEVFKKNSFIINYKFRFKDKVKIISLCEHLNFIWSYHEYINYVDYVIFSSKSQARLYKCLTKKNMYLGNTKYDNILSVEDIYIKKRLPSNQKYFLILYPKEKYVKLYNIKAEYIQKIYNYIHNLGYKIIVKSRPKDIVPESCKGDYYFSSDTYPNESLELMKIAYYCLLFSSSAIEETVMMGIPTIDFKVDTEIAKRLIYLYDDKVIKQIKKWKDIKLSGFKKNLDSLDVKNGPNFNRLKINFLKKGNTSERILDTFNNYII